MDSILSGLEKSGNNKCVIKKWRTDYSSLLKCWSLIKTSELIKEIAYKQLKQFKANDKAIHRLKSFLERNEYKSSFEQSINLWNKAIDQFINQKKHSDAAECLENLAEIELKYGKGDKKKECICKLVKAATYYKRCGQLKRSITALKRAIIIAEFTQRSEFNFIVNSYEECSNMYELLQLFHLAKINLKTSHFFDKEEKSIASQKQMSEQSMHSRPSTPSTISINSESEESQDFEESVDQNKSRESDTSSDSTDSQMSSTLDSRKRLGSPIKSETSCTTSDTTLKSFAFNKHSNLEPQQQNYKNIRIDEEKSKQLLPQNLRLITNSIKVTQFSDTSDFDDSNDTIYYKPTKKLAKRVPQKCSTNKNSVNVFDQSISEINDDLKRDSIKTRKRKLKPKENSEELPEKRLIKLEKNGLPHNFIIDPKMPLKRLICTVCEESIFSYRWSIITDHLKSQKHKESSINNNEYLLNKDIPQCSTISNNNNKNVELIFNTINAPKIGENVSVVQFISNTTCGKAILIQENQKFDPKISSQIIIKDSTLDEHCSVLESEAERIELEETCEEENRIVLYRSLNTPPSILKTPEPQPIDSPLSDFNFT